MIKFGCLFSRQFYKIVKLQQRVLHQPQLSLKV